MHLIMILACALHPALLHNEPFSYLTQSSTSPLPSLSPPDYQLLRALTMPAAAVRVVCALTTSIAHTTLHISLACLCLTLSTGCW
jgi:hypothetical protein